MPWTPEDLALLAEVPHLNRKLWEFAAAATTFSISLNAAVRSDNQIVVRGLMSQMPLVMDERYRDVLATLLPDEQ